MKSQISIIKLQMVRQAHHPEPSRRANLNPPADQHSMTETFIPVESHRSAKQ